MSPGLSIAHYRVTAKLGEGGMGEVWRAVDTRLNRDVAIKILPESFAQDPDRLARFIREAQVLAALNHPNIAAIYGVEERALVMELVPGATLAEGIAQGPVPIEEALAIARQIAEALEYAHERGIIHRDLNPANIKVTPEGRVKVLDFGLAKAMTSEAPSDPSMSPMSSPTLTMRATMAGVILGTAAYMSPEQARGQDVDRRADVWAFGVVLYEMLTGRALFAGPTISDTLAAVLKTELDWSALPAGTPPAILKLLRHCLERDRSKRLRDMGDAFLDEMEEPPAPVVVGLRRRPYSWMAAAALLSTALVLLALVHFREQPQPNFCVSVLPPEKTSFAPVIAQGGGFAISPDGRTLAFVARQEGRNLLWVQRLDLPEARPLSGTENAYYPFWSPDNRHLAFFAGNQLKKIEVAGGPPQVICEATIGRGGTWNRDGTIVFSAIDRTLHRVSASGGQTAKLSALDPARQENAHYWPEFLPDGKHFLYFARSGLPGKSVIAVGSVDDKPGSGRRIELMSATANAKYVPPMESGSWHGRAGWIIFLRDKTLLAVRFDTSRLELEGEGTAIAHQIGYIGNIGLANFSVSPNGVLVYGPEGTLRTRLMWTDREGRQTPAVNEIGSHAQPRLSPDGARAAVASVESQTGNLDIWQIDLAHAITTRFTFHPARDSNPTWSPDGTQIVFGSSRESRARLYLKPSSGTANEQPMPTGSGPTQSEYPCDWSRDGRYILFDVVGGATGADLWVLPMKGSVVDGKPRPFVHTPSSSEILAEFSPDVKWIAYTSDESGRNEVYVRSFPDEAGKFQISNNGGSEPHWRGDGKELYYLAGDSKLMAVTVKASANAFVRETPRMLFEAHWMPSNGLAYSYDVTRDGQRFLGVVAADSGETQALTLIAKWQARLKQ